MKKNHDEIREAVRENYSKVAENSAANNCGCVADSDNSCCAPAPTNSFYQISAKLGYSENELQTIPEGANLGLGCGNPQAIAAIQKGETVLDLGSGAGFDVFLAANQLENTGKAIGVDMTPKMISTARENARKGKYTNVEFRLGEIEYLPVADNSVDVVISNCVINLSPEKQKVFNEVFRVLKPGGRIAVSDVIATTILPKKVKEDMAMYSSCISGASTIQELERMLTRAGFVNIKISPKNESKAFIREWAPGTTIHDYIVSATIEASKPNLAQVSPPGV
ncbi:arsenite methyltransferase [Prolixibacteraceae bacterium Z1-6]|uniref:Arsenite methyltransferase n=1 Tax=Draconibacterium aestuarii TaxID=2998507 RepID=A0A9X3FD01_9BACT|nr:arsenite methyltransferase [Prolixibacteraceae bacterium Z1-6]